MRLTTLVTSPRRRRSRLLLGLIVTFVPLLGSCSGCGDDTLHDVSCHPGDPASGPYDEDLPELCDNRIDDNCNGQINEGCACLDGETFTCGTDEGECESTTVTCVGGQFPGCVPKKGSTPEVCDGLDNDCRDGVDNGIEPVVCWEGPEDAVFSDNAPCSRGLSLCENGAMGPCRGQVLPVAEQCNLVDDDCNGTPDDNPVSDGRPCGPDTNQGQCDYGEELCVGGESVCVGAAYAQNEVCDGVNNDCDNETDEELFRLCETACGQGIETCSAGNWVNCSAAQPSPEVCDGVDNDCDGTADEGCPCVAGDAQTCTENMVDENGEPISCGVGVQICDLNGQWGQCRFFGTETEKCDNWDNDCDGVVDEIVVSCGDPLTAGIGQCTLGTDTCVDGVWGGCLGAVGPQDEICDGIDNNCNHLVDEDLNPHDRVDMVFAIDISGSMCPYIDALAQGIGQYVQDFQGTDHRFALVVFPGDWQNVDPYFVVQPLTDAATFQAALTALDCNGGGLEPSYDVLYALLDPTDPALIGWRGDDPLTPEADHAFPYVVLMGDENAQVLAGSMVTEQLVAARATACGLPGCVPGDYVETFGIIQLVFASQYDEITYFEPERLVEIVPADADRYTEMLRDIFANVCLPFP